MAATVGPRPPARGSLTRGEGPGAGDGGCKDDDVALTALHFTRTGQPLPACQVGWGKSSLYLPAQSLDHAESDPGRQSYVRKHPHPRTLACKRQAALLLAWKESTVATCRLCSCCCPSSSSRSSPSPPPPPLPAQPAGLASQLVEPSRPRAADCRRERRHCSSAGRRRSSSARTSATYAPGRVGRRLAQPITNSKCCLLQ